MQEPQFRKKQKWKQKSEKKQEEEAKEKLVGMNVISNVLLAEQICWLRMLHHFLEPVKAVVFSGMGCFKTVIYLHTMMAP